jgi:hypothetical protein
MRRLRLDEPRRREVAGPGERKRSESLAQRLSPAAVEHVADPAFEQEEFMREHRLGHAPVRRRPRPPLLIVEIDGDLRDEDRGRARVEKLVERVVPHGRDDEIGRGGKRERLPRPHEARVAPARHARRHLRGRPDDHEMEAVAPRFEQPRDRLHLRRPVRGDPAAQHRDDERVELHPEGLGEPCPQGVARDPGGRLHDRAHTVDMGAAGIVDVEFGEGFLGYDHAGEGALPFDRRLGDLPGAPEAAPDPGRGAARLVDRAVDRIEDEAAVEDEVVARAQGAPEPDVVDEIVGEFLGVVRALLDERQAGKAAALDERHAAREGHEEHAVGAREPFRDERAALGMSETASVRGQEDDAALPRRRPCRGRAGRKPRGLLDPGDASGWLIQALSRAARPIASDIREDGEGEEVRQRRELLRTPDDRGAARDEGSTLRAVDDCLPLRHHVDARGPPSVLRERHRRRRPSHRRGVRVPKGPSSE